MITRGDIDRAWERIAGHVRITPTLNLEQRAFDGRLQSPTTLKLELTQVAGSFKPRGAFNSILSQLDRAKEAGVIAASGGNHGIATAYAARQLGLRAEIFVPVISSPVKQRRLRDLGAVLNVVGDNYYGALAACIERQKQTGALDVHAYNKPETLAGQGTCGRELNWQEPGLDTVLVATGGGGFIAGIAAWYAGSARVISVEPESSHCLAAAMRAGHPVDVSVGGVAADSLGATRIGELSWEICKRHVERAVTVTDAAILETQGLVWQHLRMIAEPGGATALAALLSGVYKPLPTERVGVFMCGGNADLSVLIQP